MELFISQVEFFLVAYVLFTLVGYILLAFTSHPHWLQDAILRLNHQPIPANRINYPVVTVVVPAFNESSYIVQNLKFVLEADYPNLQFIVVDDGSTDDTKQSIIKELGLVKGTLTRNSQISDKVATELWTGSYGSKEIYLLTKEHDGKAGSLNLGIDYAWGDLVCCLDADSVITKDALKKLVHTFLDYPELIALGGTVAPNNNVGMIDGKIYASSLPKTFIEKVQILEYLRAFMAWRVAWSHLNALLIISGALTIFKRQALIDIAGYKKESITEDMEIIFRLHQHYANLGIAYKISALPDVVCWTRVPDNLNRLKKQRIRWMYGALQGMKWHKHLLFSRKSKMVGWVALPYLIFIEFFAPVVELIGFIVLGLSVLFGFISWHAFVIYWLMTYSIAGLYTWYCIYLSDTHLRQFHKLKDILILALVGLLEPIGYRQRDAWWRLKAWYLWLSGNHVNWK